MQLGFEDLKRIREKHKNKKIVICAGWFDMFHYGHLTFLNNAKDNGDILIVVVMNDQGVKPLKGNDRPIISENQRLAIVDNIKSVDYTILSDTYWDIEKIRDDYQIGLDYKEQLLWKEYISIIDEVQADIVFSLNETIDYSSMQNYFAKKQIKIVYTDYTKDISTTKIVNTLKA